MATKVYTPTKEMTILCLFGQIHEFYEIANKI